MRIIDVTAGILMQGGRVLLAQRAASDGIAPLQWELPGGKVEENETPEQSLKRELREELGIEATVGPFFASCRYQYPHAIVNLMAYRIDAYQGTCTNTEHARITWAPLNTLLDYDCVPADIPIIRKLISNS